MKSRQKADVNRYAKFRFTSEEEAQKAKHVLARKYPGSKMKTTPAGSLFVCTKGSMLFELKIFADVIALGGADA